MAEVNGRWARTPDVPSELTGIKHDSGRDQCLRYSGEIAN